MTSFTRITQESDLLSTKQSTYAVKVWFCREAFSPRFAITGTNQRTSRSEGFSWIILQNFDLYILLEWHTCFMFCLFSKCNLDRNHFDSLLLSVEHTGTVLLVFRGHKFPKCFRNHPVFPRANVFQTHATLSETQFYFSLFAENKVALKRHTPTHGGKKSHLCIREPCGAKPGFI